MRGQERPEEIGRKAVMIADKMLEKAAKTSLRIISVIKVLACLFIFFFSRDETST